MYSDKIQIRLYKYENSAFALQAVIDDFMAISWQSTKYEAGQFTIEINFNLPNASLFKKGMFVQFGNDEKKFGFINEITDTVDESGKGSQMRSIIGYDCRYLYKRRIIRNLNSEDTWTMTASGELCMRNLIYDQCGGGASAKRRLPITNTIPQTGIGGNYTVSEAYSNLYDVLVTIATQSGIMWSVDFENGALVLNFSEGNDLSNTVRLDTDFDSLKNGEYTDSFDSFSNAVFVGGQGQGSGREIYEGESLDDGGNSPSGFDRFESWDDCSTLTQASEYQTEAESVLNEYAQTFSLTGAGLASCPYIYGENYNVGDTVTVDFNNIETTVEIQSVTEHWERGTYDLEFEFGKPIRSLKRQLECFLSQVQSYNATSSASTTDSVHYYTIPDDTAMASDEVTFETIGFIGTIGAGGSTFTLYKNGNTGVKTYHVYMKQLGTSGGKLTLTTGVSGASDLTLSSGTYVAIINVDSSGNVLSGGSTATDSITSGSSQPVTSGAVYSGLANKVSTSDITSSITSGSSQPVTSGAVYSALQTVETTSILATLEEKASGITSTAYFTFYRFGKSKTGLLVGSISLESTLVGTFSYSLKFSGVSTILGYSVNAFNASNTDVSVRYSFTIEDTYLSNLISGGRGFTNCLILCTLS